MEIVEETTIVKEPITHVAKVIELVGSSDKGWTEAAQAALEEAKRPSKTLQDWR